MGTPRQGWLTLSLTLALTLALALPLTLPLTLTKVWALHVPEGEDEAEGGRWVPGRVLLHRVVRTGAGGGTQMKVSLDGYDSETDEWVDCGSERVRPYAASTDAKEAARQEAAENEASRLYAEQRKRDDRLELSLAASGFQG